MSVDAKDCPECGSDLIGVDSSYSMRVSVVSCTDCGFEMQDKCSEDALVKKWNKLERKVVFDDDD